MTCRSAMASLGRRCKWHCHTMPLHYRKEILFFFLLLLTGIVIVHIIVSMEQNDGTYIDLSPERQKELIDEWVQKREQQKLALAHGAQEDTVNLERDLQEKLELKAAQLEKKYNKAGAKRQEEEKKKQRQKDEEELVLFQKDINAEKKRVNGVADAIGKNSLPLKVNDSEANVPGLEGGRAMCTLYDVTTDIEAEFECVKLALKPQVPVCLHPHEKDIHVSRVLREEGVWEPHLVREFQNILYADPDLGVFDIGAHIGMYTLIAASMGHKVVAVEPLGSNLIRLHKAVKLSHLEDQVTVIQNIVSDNRRVSALKLIKDNRGGTAVDNTDPCYAKGCNPTAKGIYMDDLLEVTNFKKAIMKIDIEGHEHRALKHSRRLLKEVYVPYIFMEWMKLRTYHGSEIHQSEDKDLVFWLVEYLHDMGYFAYSSVTGDRVNAKYWYSWTDDIVWKHKDHLIK